MNAKKQLKKLIRHLEAEYLKAVKAFKIATTEAEKLAFCFKSLALADAWGYLHGMAEDGASIELNKKLNIN